MQISPFLLHYPDGSVAVAIKKEQKPDAFLLSSPKGISYWVSLNFSSEVVSVQEAQKKAHAIKIEHEACSLLPLFFLLHLFDNCQKINSLLQDLGMNPIPEGYFWVKPLYRHFFILQFKDTTTKQDLCNSLNQKAMVIAGKEQIFSNNELKALRDVELAPKKKGVTSPQVSPHPERYRSKPQPLRQH